MRELSEIMRVLPQEIYDEIASQFEAVIPYQEPPRGAPRNTSPFVCYDMVTAWYGRNSRPDVETLKDLCLVSKAFNLAATTVLFRNTRSLWTPRCAYWWLQSRNSLSLSLPPKYVKNLDIQLHTFFAKSAAHEQTNEDREISASVGKFIDDLSEGLNSVGGLRSLYINTGSWKSRFIYDSYGVRTGDTRAEDVDMEHLTSFLNQLCKSFSTPSSFSHLTELRLSFPSSYDFVALGKIIPGSFLQQLKALGLAVADATGPGGSSSYLAQSDLDSDGDDRFESSNLQKLYPNKQYAHAISFFLCRMIISASKLVELLSPSALSRLWIHDVELTSGSWDEVFDHLQKCDNLEYLNPSNCSYARGGSSIHYRDWNVREWEDTNNLWSTHERDGTTLVKLVESLVEKAGGRAKYPDMNIEQAMLPSEVYSDDEDDSEEDPNIDDFDDYESLHDYVSGDDDFDGEQPFQQGFIGWSEEQNVTPKGMWRRGTKAPRLHSSMKFNYATTRSFILGNIFCSICKHAGSLRLKLPLTRAEGLRSVDDCTVFRPAYRNVTEHSRKAQPMDAHGIAVVGIPMSTSLLLLLLNKSALRTRYNSL
ncbi:uncharacterized protein PAC_15570 [Phialocephala subalpina]|uniref:Uncharacterized protein n=1 Tax=Phialocephala subalpina TaxID=576137 RepID=A0A1L7XKT4_9HELO|nr:uncharacterized protein PAC_15570 [Phialocephala subalpina]